MTYGTVKWFSDARGYGFIAPDEADTDVFVHYSGIQGSGFRSLQQDQRVAFAVEHTDKGPQARQVRPM